MVTMAHVFQCEGSTFQNFAILTQDFMEPGFKFQTVFKNVTFLKKLTHLPYSPFC